LSLPENSIAEAQQELIETFSFLPDWQEKYQYIIELGQQLEPMAESDKTDDVLVRGCQSRVWMEAVMRDGRLYFAGASDAAIVSGLVALLLRVYSGRSPAEIGATDPVFLKELGLLEALSTNRGNGIAAMARAIRERASVEQAATE